VYSQCWSPGICTWANEMLDGTGASGTGMHGQVNIRTCSAPKLQGMGAVSHTGSLAGELTCQA
jgi:hypothetical protein